MRFAACVFGSLLLLVGLLGAAWSWFDDALGPAFSGNSAKALLGVVGGLAMMCWGSKLILWALS